MVAPTYLRSLRPALFPNLSFATQPCRIAPVLRTKLSPTEHAYIFHPSPFHQHRLRLSSSSSSSLPPSQQQQRPDAPVLNNQDNSSHDSSLEISSPHPTTDTTASLPTQAPQQTNTTNTSTTTPFHPTQPSPTSPRFETHTDFVQALHNLTADPLEPDGGRIVIHRGNPNANLMIIGEAPGAQEDRLGKPFVGDAGKLLDRIFHYGGFDMERQVYVTNVAKRRPVKNRTPTEEEVQFYMPYLKEEIRLVAPRIIVLAGSVAAKALLGSKARITKIRGEWFTYEDDVAMMAVFHPAYLLRNPRAKYDMVTDIEEIRAKYLCKMPNDSLRPLIKKPGSMR